MLSKLKLELKGQSSLPPSFWLATLNTDNFGGTATRDDKDNLPFLGPRTFRSGDMVEAAIGLSQRRL